MSRAHWLSLAFAALACALPARAQSADVERVSRALESVRFVAYTPRGFDPESSAPPAREALRADLELLRRDFDGLVTYSCANGLDSLAGLAREAGFRAVVLGVWSPSDSRELGRALSAARAERGVVIALALGNEGLFFSRYSAAELAAAFAKARNDSPELALATSEPFSVYLDSARASDLPRQDFLLPNVHPVDQPWFGTAPPATSIEFVANVVRDLEARYSLPVLVKETGLPSAPSDSGFTPATQAAFWAALARRLPPTRAHAFVWFEAFDSPWKSKLASVPPEKRERESHWGLYDRDGRAKPALEALRK